MNSKLPLIFLCLAFGVLCGAAFAPSRIRWNWPKENSAAILEVKYNGQLLQVGLRDDGVVVCVQSQEGGVNKPQSAFRTCPRCAGLMSARIDKCLSCGYRPRVIQPETWEVAGTIAAVLLLAAVAVMLGML